MKTWFNIKAAEKKPTVVSIYDEIGAYGVSAKAFLSAAREISARDIVLEINSPGGDVFAGIAMYNGLRALADAGKTIKVKIMGIAASAASLVAMAGDTIEMPANTMMMIHNPWTFAMGDADEMRATADVLDGISNGLIATYAKRTGKSNEDIKVLLDAETWFSAEEAVAAGFATTVTDKVEAKAQFDVERLPESVKAAWVKASAENEPVVEDPAPNTDPVTDEPEFGETLAEQVEAVAKAAGMEAYAASWVADPSIVDKAAAIARATTAREIKSLCDRAGKPDMADSLIKANKPMADARAEVFAALSDEQEHVDTAPAATNKPKPGAAQPTAVKGADIWAARKAKFTK
jgi:ATP-dependent Clp endopeptidase proteolytic subunit ClpP